MSKLINIGFMIHQIDNEYTTELLKGMIPAAKELGVNLIVLPGEAINGEYYDTVYAAYEYQKNIIYEYCSKDDLDGLIISAGTLSSFVSKEKFREFVDRYADIPLITLESKVGDYPCIRYDSSGMYKAVEHLIREHGLKRIGFVSGPRGNADAESRLEAYRRALADNNIEVDESLIAYGNFSEYSMDAVKEVMSSENGAPEGICFANDSMCIGGYKVFEEMGLKVGRDILVTGHDDSETAASLVPPLTTVRSKTSNLGYSAVKVIYKMINGSRGLAEANPISSLVIRGSCGCEFGSEDLSAITDIGDYADETIRALSDFPCGADGKKTLDELCALMRDIARECTDLSSERAKKLLDRMDMLLKSGCMEVISYVNLMTAVDRIAAASKLRCKNSFSIEAMDFIRSFERRIYDHVYHSHIDLESDFENTIFMTNNIAKDMTLYADDDADSFYSVFHKLSLIGIESSRIYFYSKPIRYRKGAAWTMPEQLTLMGCQNKSQIEIPKHDNAQKRWTEIFRSLHDDNRPRVVVASVIASNELQYGVFLCETSLPRYKMIQSIVSQLCTALRMNMLVNSLENSLYREKTNNALLSEISMTDELTHTYNRRGFYSYANSVLHSTSNAGKTAYIFFADLNNLKKINDIFGHEEGDYAIRRIAEILRSNLDAKSVIGRIGGDEFAALTVIDGDDHAQELIDKIKQSARHGNEVSDKPYIITASIGVHVCHCSDDICVQDLMEYADEALYIDKQNKEKSIYKSKNI